MSEKITNMIPGVPRRNQLTQLTPIDLSMVLFGEKVI